MRKIFIGLLMFLLCFGLQAQKRNFEYVDTSIIKTEEKWKEDLVTPEEKISLSPVANFSDSIHVWKNNSSFRYIPALDSILRDRNEKALQRTKQSENTDEGNFFSQFLNSGFLKILLWGIAIIALTYILFTFFGSTRFRRFNRKKSKSVEEMPDEEWQAPGSFAHLIEAAQQNGDYRLATRYQFLHCLSLLSENHAIEFSTEKTNAAYKRELPAYLQKEFAALVLNYEYVWYGRINISEGQYRDIENAFNQFNRHN